MEVALREQRELADALRDTAAALTRSLEPQTVMRCSLITWSVSSLIRLPTSC